MDIRNWQEKDLEAILKLNQANRPGLGSLNRGQLEKLLEQAEYAQVVETENGFAGFVIALLPNADYDSENFLWFKKRYQNFLYVDRIAIENSAQGKGFGRLIYQSLEQHCRQQDLESITLEVNIKPINQGSLDFHDKMGFVQVGTQDTNGGEKTVSLMQKVV